MSTAADMNGSDLLEPTRSDRIVSVAEVVAAVRRRGRTILGLGAAGLILGLVFGLAVPKTHSATSVLLLQFPTGADPSRAMSTDLTLLQTRSVAEAAQRSLGLKGAPEDFLTHYHGSILSDGVMRINGDGPDAATAVKRTAAVDKAFLAFRKQVYEKQLAGVERAFAQQQTDLDRQIATVTTQIENFNPATAPAGSGIDDLVSQRDDLNSQVQAIEATVQSTQIATATVVEGSRVIDTASALPLGTRKAAALDGASGLVGALAISLGVVVLLAVATNRLRRRSDFAAALRVPVAVSVGPIVPSWWKRVLGRTGPPPDPGGAPADLELVVRHLRSALDSAASPALVVVAIDTVAAAELVVLALQKQLAAEGSPVSIINETGRNLPSVVVPTLEPASERTGAIALHVVLVIATLEPMHGAEHLREWASDAVVLVTPGRSTPTKVEANAAMLRSADVRLRTAVLIGTDSTDDSLGIFEDRSVPAIGPRRVARSDPAPTKRSS